ncbi:MAG TPA: hypothetical protein DEA73_00220 [Peptococcaceae bacterium]|nr:MAG: Transcriptional regulator, CdaR [Moorella sp. 60_41]HBT46296.1 hypothetical protein [Peptococcaceae bacterium]
MSLKVRQALSIGPLRRAKLVAGRRGLDNEITFVNIMEVPEVARWMKGGELLLTAGYAFKDNPELRRRIIYDLAGKGVAAFGIKPGQYLFGIPEDMVEHAERVGLPLLELPPDVPYMEIMLPIFELLINEQLYRRRRTDEIHNLLLNVLLRGTGLQGVCSALAQFTANPVFIFGYGTCLGAGYPPLAGSETLSWHQQALQEIFREVPPELQELVPHRATILRLSPELPESVVVPVACREKIEGYLVILQSSRHLNDIEIRGIETGATIVALEFAKEKAVAETEIRLRGELLDELLKGEIENAGTVLKRAAHLGINLAGRLAVIVVGFQGPDKASPYEVEIPSEVIHLLRSRFSRHPGGVLVVSRDSRVVGLLRFYSETEKELPERLGEILKAAKARFSKVRFGVGVGRPYEGLEYVKTSYEEAQVALKVALDRREEKPVFFSELGPLRVLFYVKDAPAAYTFCQEYIGKLKAYDAQNKTDLTATLACYLKNDGNLRRTAQALFVHKNSVIYRLKKIQEITGLDLNDAENRFALMLALKLTQLTP